MREIGEDTKGGYVSMCNLDADIYLALLDLFT